MIGWNRVFNYGSVAVNSARRSTRSACRGALYSSIAEIDSYYSKVSQLLCYSKKQTFEISQKNTVYEAIEKMVQRKVGALIVIEDQKLVGIISERDYLTKVILRNRASKSTLVEDIMTRDVITVTPDTSVGECVRIMSENSVRHLPVIENDQVISVLSIRELLATISSDHEKQVQYLQDQITKLANIHRFDSE